MQRRRNGKKEEEEEEKEEELGACVKALRQPQTLGNLKSKKQETKQNRTKTKLQLASVERETKESRQ